MIKPRLFVSRRALETGLAQGVIKLEGEGLLVTADPGLRWDITAGVIFERLRPHNGDKTLAQNLCGQMRSSDELDQMRADHLGSVVVVDGWAYDVRAGFIVSFSREGVALDRLMFAWSQLSDALADPTGGGGQSEPADQGFGDGH